MGRQLYGSPDTQERLTANGKFKVVSDMPNCHGPSCVGTNLIKAHIIPSSFAAYIRGDDPKVPNVQLTLTNSKNAQPQLGDYDPSILCERCDGRLGLLDDYAIGVTRDFPTKAVRTGDFYIMPDVDGDRLARFFLSVIWRAAVTSRPNFAEIELGPYTDTVRDVVFSGASMDANTTLQVALERFESAYFDASRMFSIPRPAKSGGLNGYGFMLGGFRAFVKIDRRVLPGIQINGVLNGKGPLRLRRREMEGTSEFDATAKMMVAAHSRQRK
jgi:hypothetical protein